MLELYHEQVAILSCPIRGASGVNRRLLNVSPRPHDMLCVWPPYTISRRFHSLMWAGCSKACPVRWQHLSTGEWRWEGPVEVQATTPTLGWAETTSTQVCWGKHSFPRSSEKQRRGAGEWGEEAQPDQQTQSQWWRGRQLLPSSPLPRLPSGQPSES